MARLVGWSKRKSSRKNNFYHQASLHLVDVDFLHLSPGDSRGVSISRNLQLFQPLKLNGDCDERRRRRSVDCGAMSKPQTAVESAVARWKHVGIVPPGDNSKRILKAIKPTSGISYSDRSTRSNSALRCSFQFVAGETVGQRRRRIKVHCHNLERVHFCGEFLSVWLMAVGW